MSRQSKIIYFIISILFFIFFDIFCTDFILKSRFDFLENPLFDLIYVQNKGAAFSIFENSQIFLIVFAILAMLLILVYGIRNIEKFSTVAVFWCSILLAGIGSNLYERINFGFVRDFIMLKFVDFPIFNLSDIFITIGVSALVVLIVKNKYLKK